MSLVWKSTRLPEDVAGKVILLAMGFGSSAHADVESWDDAFRGRFHGRSDVGVYQMAMLGDIARFASSIIETGMRFNTRAELRGSVITVYERIAPLRRALGASEDSDTWIYLMGRGGRIPFKCCGEWDELLFRQLASTDRR